MEGASSSCHNSSMTWEVYEQWHRRYQKLRRRLTKEPWIAWSGEGFACATRA
ncbi:hypothetical protein SAMN05519103_09679 [Rhizobiales bacterium GAS113]|nr:hypothetical protein SAMN05519103_09679 [Rhizobiales bacterium GAS113]